MNRFAVLDFETTGVSPIRGDKPTEVAVVIVEEGRLVDSWQSLMNPGRSIPFAVQQLTGISDRMVRDAPPMDEVMAMAADFVGDTPLLAHNAPFDRRFWQAAMERIGRPQDQEFFCSLRLSRRLLPGLASYALSALVEQLALPSTGRYHRALADAEATAWLLLHLQQQLQQRFAIASAGQHLLRLIQDENIPVEQCVAAGLRNP